MNTALSTSHADAAFYRDRKAMLMYPVLVLPFIAILFGMFGGGKGERFLADQLASDKPSSAGFNANVPTAKNGKIDGRNVDAPGYGKANVGQVLSSFTNTRQDSASQGLKALPIKNGPSASDHASSLAIHSIPAEANATEDHSQKQAYLHSRKRKGSTKGGSAYYYQAPGYTGSGSDQQIASQLRTYENTRYAASMPAVAPPQPTGELIASNRIGDEARPASVQLSDNLTATRLSEPTNAADAFNTAPTSGSRRLAERAVISGGNSYGSKKTVAWMIPVVVHEDQVFKSGNTVKLRLTKEISADGITIPANTILHALCQSGEDRLRMTVQSLQLNGQLIPLDLEVYDMDGLAGVNMPGLSNQVGGQLKSSAVQGLQVPGVGGLVNTVANQARMSASNSMRQATVRLRAGYNLYLKAQ